MFSWMMSWGDSPFGGLVLFLVAVIEAAFFPIPPEMLLATLVLGRPVMAWRFAALCTSGSLLGAVAGYGVGWGLWGVVDGLFYQLPGVTPAAFAEMADGYHRYGLAIVLVAALAPVPYTLVTVSAGVFGMDFGPYIAASAVGRGAKFMLIAALLWRYGPRIRPLLDRYPERFGLLVGLVLLGLLLYSFL